MGQTQKFNLLWHYHYENAIRLSPFMLAWISSPSSTKLRFNCRTTGTSQAADDPPERRVLTESAVEVGPWKWWIFTDTVFYSPSARTAKRRLANLLLFHQPRGHILHYWKVSYDPRLAQKFPHFPFPAVRKPKQASLSFAVFWGERG